jgi:tRNA(Met) cytidine acetyltransferase
VIREVVADLRAEARAGDERRALVLAGGPGATAEAAQDALQAAGLDHERVTVLADRDTGIPAEHVAPKRAGELLGTTRDAVVVDAHDAFPPNALGRSVGAIEGGGLLVLACPALAAWPDRRDGFDERLVVPPFSLEEVTGHVRRRFVATLRDHPGIAIFDADAAELRDDGLTHPAPRRPPDPPAAPEDRAFPRAAYEACLSTDQVEAVRALERLREPGCAVVVEADRGRGKSSAAGLAAGSLAAEGREVLVTAPGYRNAATAVDRAGELLAELGDLAGEDSDSREVRATGGGRVRFERPPAAVDAIAAREDHEPPDALVVDEAAAIPVRLLESLAAGKTPVAFATTVHGYEGAGRGFSVRFRDHLAASDRDVADATMSRPIRYAAGDPVEVWAFRALLLDAAPPADPLVAGATPGTARYVRLDPGALVADEHLLREAFGLLVNAHYRTEPNDLARLLDAPNVTTRALLHDGRVVAVALLAWEGELSADRRQEMYEGARVPGNMLPDVLTSQLRDPDAGVPRGLRVMRIATHHAVRSTGLGSHLLSRVRDEFDPESDSRTVQAPGADGPDAVGRRLGRGEGTDDSAEVRSATGTAGMDYLGVGYGATPRLLAFWRANDYRTVHLSTSRNDRSGEYSALQLCPLSERGRDLHDRSARWFVRRIADGLADALDDADPDVVRAALAACDAAVPLDLSERGWRTVASAAYGPGLYDAAPTPFRRLALRALVDGTDLDADAERLLVRKVLQARPWPTVVDDLDFTSRRTAMRALGEAFQPLVDRYGADAASEEADRYR